MGNIYAYRGRLTPALIVLALVPLVIVALGMVAGPAKATSDSFTLCSSCHNYSMGDAFHSKPGHVAAPSCSTCHVAGSGAAGLRPSACASCHGKANILAKASHPAATCGVAGCHAAPSPTPTPTAPAVVTTTITAAKVKPNPVKVGKKAVVSGTAGPAASLAGAKVTLKVERKVGTKWVKMKTGSVTASATGAFKWTYKATKKGAHRATMSIAKTSTYTAKKVVKSFKVK